MAFKRARWRRNGLECLQGRVVDVSVEHPSRKSRVGNAKPIWAMVLGQLVYKETSHYVTGTKGRYFVPGGEWNDLPF